MSIHLPLVGRTAEVAEVQQRIAGAAAGQGSLLLVGGEAGVGKTALLEATLRSPGPLLSATGRCPGFGETAPFGPWLGIVGHLQRQGWEPAPLPPPFGQAAGTEWRTETIADALADWLAAGPPEAQGTAPLLLALEDIHWADPASLDLLLYLAPRLPGLPVLAVATFRSDEVHRKHLLWPVLPQLQRAGARRLTLGRLTQADVEALVAAAAATGPGGERGGAAWAVRLFQRTEGHPLFLRELLDAALRAAPGLDPQAAPVPETLQEAIDASLARLSPPTRAMLQVAAVIGERFDWELLLRVAETPEEDLLSALEEAVAYRVIRPEGKDGECFAFDHALVREVLLEQLIGPRRRRWHLRVAEAQIQAVSPDPDLLALHLSRAGDPRATRYLLAAGDRALRLGAVAQATNRYEQALERVAEGDALRAELLLKLGRNLVYVNRKRAFDCVEEALQAAEGAGDRAVAAWAREWMVRFRTGNAAAFDEHEIRQVRAEAEEMQGNDRYLQLERDLFGANAGYPRIMEFETGVLTTLGRYDEAAALIDQLIARARSGISHHLLGHRYWGAGNRLQFREAIELAEQARDAALRVHDYREAIRAQYNAWTYLLRTRADHPEELDRAAELLAELEGRTRRHEGQLLVRAGHTTLTLHHYLRGQWDQPGTRPVQTWSPQFTSVDALVQARFGLARGDLRAARLGVAEVRPHSPDGRPPLPYNLIHWLHIQICLAEGDLEGARRWHEAIERWTAEPAMRDAYRWGTLPTSAEFHRADGKPEKAWEAASIALTEAVAINDGWTISCSHRLLGELAAAAPKRAGEAESHFAAALDLAARCRFPYELALSQLARARSLPYAPGAREGLAVARDTFARLGAAPALAEAERLLAAASTPAAAPAPGAGPALPDGLTEREAEIVRLVAQGLSDKEVGARLFISPRTVDGHLRNIFNKVNVSNRAALAAYAARRGLG